MNKSRPFRKTVVILGGDFRQTFKTKYETSRDFAKCLLDVGEGKINDAPGNGVYQQYARIPSECV